MNSRRGVESEYTCWSLRGIHDCLESAASTEDTFCRVQKIVIGYIDDQAGKVASQYLSDDVPV